VQAAGTYAKNLLKKKFNQWRAGKKPPPKTRQRRRGPAAPPVDDQKDVSSTSVTIRLGRASKGLKGVPGIKYGTQRSTAWYNDNPNQGVFPLSVHLHKAGILDGYNSYAATFFNLPHSYFSRYNDQLINLNPQKFIPLDPAEATEQTIKQGSLTNDPNEPIHFAKVTGQFQMRNFSQNYAEVEVFWVTARNAKIGNGTDNPFIVGTTDAGVIQANAIASMACLNRWNQACADDGFGQNQVVLQPDTVGATDLTTEGMVRPWHYGQTPRAFAEWRKNYKIQKTRKFTLNGGAVKRINYTIHVNKTLTRKHIENDVIGDIPGVTVSCFFIIRPGPTMALTAGGTYQAVSIGKVEIGTTEQATIHIKFPKIRKGIKYTRQHLGFTRNSGRDQAIIGESDDVEIIDNIGIPA